MVKNYAEHFVKGSVLIFFISILTNVISYLTRIFLARALTPVEYGLIYAVLSFLGLLNIFRTLGFSDTLRKKIPEYIINKNYVKIKSSIVFAFIINFLYMFAVFLIVFLFSGYFSSNVLGNIDGANVLIIIALSGVLTAGYGTIVAAFQGLHKVKIYSSLDFLTYLFRLIFIVALISLGVMAIAYSYLITSIITLILAFLIFNVKFSFITRAKIRINKKFSKEILYFSTPLMIGYVASSIFSNVDTVLVSIFRSLTEVGLYQVAQPLSNLLTIVAGSLTIILMPMVSELKAKNNSKMLSVILSLITKALFIIILPIAMVLIAFPENVISMLFGDAYIAAALPMQILSVGAIFMSLNYILSAAIIGIGKPGLNTKISFVTMFIGLGLNLALIPLIGIAGASITFLISSVVCFFILAFYSSKHIKVNMDWVNMLKIFAGGIITLAIIFSVKTLLTLNPWIELIFSMIVGVIFYSLFILFTKSIRRNEINIINRTNLPIPKKLMSFIMKLARD